MKFKKPSWSTVALIFLLGISLFLRLYRIADTQTFLEDEGRDMLIVKRMVDTGKPVLIGPQTSTGSMYLGPFYYYFITPALILAKMDPVGPAILIALTGTLTVYLLFQLARRWFGSFAAWVGAVLYAVMPLPVVFTRNSWNPKLAPLVSILILGVMDKLRETGRARLRWFVVLGFLVGVLIQLHYMALIAAGLLAIIIVSWWYKSPKFFKAIALGVIGFLISLAPFFIFEVRNDFVNTQAITRFIEAKEQHNLRYDLPLWLWWGKVSQSTVSLFGGLYSQSAFVAADPAVVPIVLVLFLLTVYGLFASRGDRKIRALIFVLLIGSLAVLGVYQENVHRHYLGYLFPLVYLAFVSLLSVPHKITKILALLTATFVLIYSLPTLVGTISSGSTHQTEKARRVAAYIAGQAGGRPYNLVSDGEANTTPYQYFAFIGPNPPINTAASDVFMICEGSPCDDNDLSDKQMFITGPAHPSLSAYVGHPLATYLVENIEVVSNEHIFVGTWVAHLKLTPAL